IERSRERSEHHELRERDAAALCEIGRCVKGGGVIGWQAEDERPEHVNTVSGKRLQTCDERLARIVEVLEDGLQTFRRDRFDTDQRTLDPRAAHRREKL